MCELASSPIHADTDVTWLLTFVRYGVGCQSLSPLDPGIVWIGDGRAIDFRSALIEVAIILLLVLVVPLSARIGRVARGAVMVAGAVFGAVPAIYAERRGAVTLALVWSLCLAALVIFSVLMQRRKSSRL